MAILKKYGSFRLLALVGFLAVLGVVESRAQALSEGFDVVPVAGWFTQNNSVPNGSTGWFQGGTTWPAQTGAATSWIGANFNNSTGSNTISNFLVTPVRTLKAGDTITFYTRTATASAFPDRLQVRISLAGASTNVGTGVLETSVGDFTTKVLDINPTYAAGGYPEVWTLQTIVLSAAQVPTPTSGRIAIRYFVENAGPLGANSNIIGIDTFNYTPAAAPAGDAPLDFNGDGKTDWAVVRNTGGGASGQITWFYNTNGTGAATQAFQWGLASDFFVSGDFDGDNKDDIAVWRPGAATVAAFYILNSNGFTARVERFGQTGDDPTVVEDYDGDNKTDVAVYRAGAAAGQQSTWFYRTVANGPVTYVPWGQNGDFPSPGDYDGDGKADFVVQRGVGGVAYFLTRLATGATPAAIPFGLPTDVIVPGDWDGDGKTDIATSRGVGGAIQWQYRNSSNGVTNYITFGSSATDFVVQGDYNGDGKTDAAIWRPSATANQSAFWVNTTGTNAVTIFALGANGDYPPANFNSH